MKTLFLILTFFSFMSCSNDDSPINPNFNLEDQVYLSYKNANGENLLDPSTENAFNVEDMKLFYQIDNELVEVNSNNFPRGGVELTVPNQYNSLTVFTNFSKNNLIEQRSEYNIVENIAYLQLTENDTDTIRTYSKSNQNYFLVSKVWYNDELVWERETGGVIEIMKE